MNPKCPNFIKTLSLLIFTKIEARITAIIAEYSNENCLKVNSLVIVLSSKIKKV